MSSTDPAGLRYFQAVAITGSVTAAGRSLFVAPSAVSRQIHLLEDELGVALFSRGARGMTLTAAGHRVLAFAAETRQRAADLRAELDADRHAVRGHVVVATVEGMLTRFVPDAIGALAVTHPDIRIDVHAAGAHDVSAAVASGTAQLGFVFGSPTRSDVVALRAQPLPLSVMVRPDDALAGGPACSLRELAGHPVAVPTPDFGIRQELDRACAESGTRLKVCYETNSLALLRQIAVRTGAAIFMAAQDTAAELAAGSLIRVPLTDRRLTSTQVTLVKALPEFSTAAAKIVSDALLTAMGDF
jgi:DNA-binding transcriptional LysR family regulator